MSRIVNVVLGYPLGNPGHNCVMVDPAVQYFWQNTPCSKSLGYICYRNADEEHLLTQGKALLLLKQYVAEKTSATTYQPLFFSAMLLLLLQLPRQASVGLPGFPSTAAAFDSFGLSKRGLMLKNNVRN